MGKGGGYVMPAGWGYNRLAVGLFCIGNIGYRLVF